VATSPAVILEQLALSAGGNVFGNNFTATNTVFATGNITGGNINSDAAISAIGCISQST
jgi:hypothetical protein